MVCNLQISNGKKKFLRSAEKKHLPHSGYVKMPGTYALLLLNVKQVTSEAPIKL
jgi:hypothetical protein